MFVGHFGVGLAAKAIDAKPSLGTLFMASQFIDLLWPVLLIAGVERVDIQPGNTAVTPLDFVSYPISHSLLMVVGWAVLFGGIYYLIRRNVKTAVLTAALVLSHWLLDLIVHRPDLPLIPGAAAKFGLGVWNSVLLTVLIEGGLFIVGCWLYMRSTRAVNKKGAVLMWAFFAFLTVLYIMNLIGPPPPSAKAIAYVGFSTWLLVGWGYWMDRNRRQTKREPLSDNTR